MKCWDLRVCARYLFFSFSERVCVWACDSCPFFSSSFKVNLSFNCRIALPNLFFFFFGQTYLLSPFLPLWPCISFCDPHHTPCISVTGAGLFRWGLAKCGSEGEKVQGRQLTLPACLNQRVNLQWGHNGFSLANHPRCRQPVTSRVPVRWPFVVSLSVLSWVHVQPQMHIWFALYIGVQRHVKTNIHLLFIRLILFND